MNAETGEIVLVELPGYAGGNIIHTYEHLLIFGLMRLCGVGQINYEFIGWL